MNYILFDDARRESLLPLTFVRPIADIRIGIDTIREKWEYYLKKETSTLTENYLSKKYPLIKEEENILINGAVIPDEKLVQKINDLSPNQALIKGDCVIAMFLTSSEIDDVSEAEYEEFEYEGEYTCIRNTYDIFVLNEEIIAKDFERFTQGRKSASISNTNFIIEDGNVFVEEGAKVEGATINAKNGPVYIGKDAEVMEGALIRGPFVMLPNAVVKMGAKIYGATTLGPYVKVGGEVNNCVIFGYSNKAHDGFIGNSVIGEWCNLGADTNNSNLKNNYSEVRLWNYAEESFVGTGLQFCGMIMGDYSKTGISTMINTGTVIGVSVNIYGSGFQRNFVPSFTWGSPARSKKFELDLAFEIAQRTYERRGLTLTDAEKEILTYINELSFTYRRI